MQECPATSARTMSAAATATAAQAEASASDAALPAQIGKYRILGRLGDGDRLDPALDRGLRAQRSDQLGGDFARISLLRLRQRHRRGDREVAVLGLARRLERCGKRMAGTDFGDRGAQGIEQFFTGRDHRLDSTRRVS